MTEIDKIEILDDKVADLSRRLDEMAGKAVASERKPWYKSLSSLLAVSAFALSLISFLYSTGKDALDVRQTQRREAFESRQAKMAALESTLGQLNAITQEWAEGTLKFNSQDPSYTAYFVPAMDQATRFTSEEAYSLFKQLPKGDVSAADVAMIALGLESSKQYSLAQNLLSDALPSANTLQDIVLVARMLGQISFYENKPKDGDGYFKKARDETDKLAPAAGISPSEANLFQAETERYWAVAEASIGACEEARSHLARSEKEVQLSKLNFNPDANGNSAALIASCVSKTQ